MGRIYLAEHQNLKQFGKFWGLPNQPTSHCKGCQNWSSTSVTVQQLELNSGTVACRPCFPKFKLFKMFGSVQDLATACNLATNTLSKPGLVLPCPKKWTDLNRSFCCANTMFSLMVKPLANPFVRFTISWNTLKFPGWKRWKPTKAYLFIPKYN